MSNSASFNGYSDLPETIYVEHGFFPPETNRKANDIPPEAVSYSDLPETIYVEHGVLPPETNLKEHNVSYKATFLERSDTGSTTNEFDKTEESTKKRTLNRRRLIWIGTIIVLIVLVGVGLGVGLEFGLKRHARQSEM